MEAEVRGEACSTIDEDTAGALDQDSCSAEGIGGEGEICESCGTVENDCEGEADEEGCSTAEEGSGAEVNREADGTA